MKQRKQLQMTKYTTNEAEDLTYVILVFKAEEEATADTAAKSEDFI